MALILNDRVKETTTTTGTSDFALAGAETGFQSFSAGVGANNTTYYSVTDNTDWEVGLGTLSSDGLTLARTSVLQSSNSDAKVDFASGTKRIFVTYPADKAVLSDAAQTLTNKTIAYADNTITGVATSAQGALADSAVQPADLATVATTGAYSDLSGTPTLGTAAATDATDYATAAQGALADSAIQPNDDAILNSVQLVGGTGTQGTISWNTDELTADLIQNGTTLQLGQEVQYNVRNNTGSTIADGTPVYATGTLGASSRITVAPYIADGSIAAKYFIGVTTESIANGEDGKVTHFGKVRGIDLSAYSDGDVLYPSASTAGAFTAIEPAAPNISLPIGFVIHAAANGTLFVRVNALDRNAFATASQGTLADSAVQPGDLATVATSGAYTDLTGTPTLGTAAATDSADYATAAQGSLADSAVQPGDNISSLTNDSGYLDTADIGVSVQAYDADTAKLDVAQTFTAVQTMTALKETKVAMAASDIDLSAGNYFTKTISGATTLTLSNVASSGSVSAFVLDLTNGGSATVTWFSGVKWNAATAPTLTASGRDVLAFFSHDGGTTWNGFVLGLGMA